MGFELALEAQQRKRGIVGSTRNILDFIVSEVAAAAKKESQTRIRLPFILGTEAGMITSIVTHIQKLLKDLQAHHVDCEIIFPVAEDAMAADPDSPLGVVPGVTAGEGCSAGGGCATCPYMKMNSLDSLFDVLGLIGDEKKALTLKKYETETYADSVRTTRIGVISINHMRQFTNTGLLGTDLVEDVTTRTSSDKSKLFDS